MKGAFIGSWGLNGERRSLAGELIRGGGLASIMIVQELYSVCTAW